jgi:hypothetical protein
MQVSIENLLDTILLSLSPKDHLTFRDFCKSSLILGGLGSGKSSTSGRTILSAMLSAGLGAVIHTVKGEDTADAIACAEKCGRGRDVLVFNEKSGLTFDPLAYEWSREGRGSNDAETIIHYFSTLLAIGKQPGSNNERFWELAAEQAQRHAIHLIRLAQEPLSIVNIHRAIQSYPTSPGQHEEESWQRNAYTAQLINQIRTRKDTLSEEDWSDLDVATQFVLFQWAALDEKPRSSIEMTFSGLADKFLFSPFRRIFASGTFSFTPEQVTHNRLILIIDFPILEYGKETARLIQTMVKLTFQRAWLRHKFTPGCCNGAALFQDEFQMLIHRDENHFAQVCRGSGIASVYMTQTILNLAEELSESQPGSKTKAFLNNLSIKIAHHSTCPDSSNYMAEVIGKEYRYMESYNAGGGNNGGHAHTGVGGSQQLVHMVEPIEFTRLASPDSHNPYAEAICYVGGRAFEATKSARNPQGRNYLKVTFSRNL